MRAREEIAALLNEHRSVEDSRGEIKRCSCGTPFGVQHHANGSYGKHRLDTLTAWLAEHDAEVGAKAIQEAAREFAEGAWADAFAGGIVTDDVTAVQATDRWFVANATRIALATTTTEVGV